LRWSHFRWQFLPKRAPPSAQVVAGAGVGALQDNEKKKQQAAARDAYQREYSSCMQGKGL
jgi:hypothetical protein